MEKIKYFLFLITFHFVYAEKIIHPNVELTVPQLIEKYGYPAETHEVETEDGYLLAMYRIPHGLLGNETNTKPILLMHGLSAMCESYIVGAAYNVSLAFLLADNGYDVWLGNTRGNLHSQKHITLDPVINKTKFWQFSWHEIGVYDQPAKIDYILNNTNAKKISYVGHSQGGTSYAVMAAARPEYNEKINVAILMAPAVYMTSISSEILKIISIFHSLLDQLARAIGLYEVPPLLEPIKNVLSELCQKDQNASDTCDQLYLEFTHGDEAQLNKGIVHLIVEGLSTMGIFQPLHYAQEINSGHFRQYDFGEEKNLEKYNNSIPPDYNLENLVAPIVLIYSDGDMIVAKEDIEKLYKVLPNGTIKYLVPFEKFTHFDYLFGKDVVNLVYNPMLEFLQKYNNTYR